MSFIHAMDGDHANIFLFMGLNGKGNHIVDLFASNVFFKPCLLQLDRCWQFYPHIELLPGDTVERARESRTGIVNGQGA